MNRVNILVVEDNKMDYFICEKILSDHFKEKLEIKNVTSLGAAISEIGRNDIAYNLVLLDLNINNSHGINTLRVFSEKCTLPIIVYSGISAPDIIKKSREFGAAEYICKGEETVKVINIIESTLARAANAKMLQAAASKSMERA